MVVGDTPNTAMMTFIACLLCDPGGVGRRSQPEGVSTCRRARTQNHIWRFRPGGADEQWPSTATKFSPVVSSASRCLTRPSPSPHSCNMSAREANADAVFAASRKRLPVYSDAQTIAWSSRIISVSRAQMAILEPEGYHSGPIARRQLVRVCDHRQQGSSSIKHGLRSISSGIDGSVRPSAVVVRAEACGEDRGRRGGRGGWLCRGGWG
ncbi:hypothetical protein FA95DRAFT_1077528 [Auriscalpium vulgare]|uniref:Uncharacterized protein n=1 Tax=Auriscalpium vulgare TaxID=40419 RepID=A0ACB8RWN8_9AGAM|nr:hypothetical protein FA95DRAFT_1077528 [Auriscalpium vulgare]